MLRRIPRVLRRAVLVTVLMAVTVSVIQSWAAGTPGTGGWVQTEFGPLGPADRDLLVKVRLAGLWEGPTGQQAQQQASSAEVQELGEILAGEHAELDRQVREVADQLGVLLPSAPNAEQLGWMEKISASTGSEYDRLFVQLLRQAHGTVLPVIAEVRSGTRNALIREFAGTADEFVSRHIGHLEATGLVDYAGLPEPPSPGLLSGAAGPLDLVVPGLVFLAALLGAAGIVAAVRRAGPDPRRPERARLPLAAIPAPRGAPSPRTSRHALRR
jgi:predicted outer membrane protein